MSFLLNGKPVDALALIVHRSSQETIGRAWVKKLRTFIISHRCFDLTTHVHLQIK